MERQWLLKHIDHYDDSSARDWEFLGLEAENGQPASASELAPEAIFPWAKKQQGKLSEAPSSTASGAKRSLGVLVSRHRDHKVREILPKLLPLPSSDFIKLVRMLRLAPDVVYARAYAGASGSISVSRDRDAEGETTETGLTIRVPHSPTNTIKSVWSLGLKWNEGTGFLTGIFDGGSDADVEFLLEAINSAEHFHPLLFPICLVELLQINYNDMRRRAGNALYALEHRVGLTRGAHAADVWLWEEHEVRSVIRDVNRLNTGLAYLDRRLDFAVRLARSLAQMLEDSKVPTSISFRRDLRDRLLNAENFCENQAHQVRCIEKKTATVVSFMYSVIAQRDSFSNLKIAAAAKEDSETMKLIGLLTTIFLPATFISSIFGMNFFAFDTDALKITLSQNFWIYWAVVLPTTLGLAGGGYIYHAQQRARAAAQSQKTTVIQGNTFREYWPY